MRQIILDTETTGLDPKNGDRIVEIACVELYKRRFTGNTWHCYLNPQRPMDPAAFAVHGLSDAFLADKKLFKEVAAEFLQFIEGAEVVIHNAPFDVGFLNYELMLLNQALGKFTDYCKVIDTLKLSRQLNPAGKHSLDALCKRYGVDNSNRELHGALIDAEILGQVFLAMTRIEGGQTKLDLAMPVEIKEAAKPERVNRSPLKIIVADANELAAHQQYLAFLADKK